MDEAQFKFRTKALALAAIDLVEHLPRTRTGDILGRQLLRSATSVGANYRASCRGRSIAEIIAKLSIVEEEADEVDRTIHDSRFAICDLSPVPSGRTAHG